MRVAIGEQASKAAGAQPVAWRSPGCLLQAADTLESCRHTSWRIWADQPSGRRRHRTSRGCPLRDTSEEQTRRTWTHARAHDHGSRTDLADAAPFQRLVDERHASLPLEPCNSACVRERGAALAPGRRGVAEKRWDRRINHGGPSLGALGRRLKDPLPGTDRFTVKTPPENGGLAGFNHPHVPSTSRRRTSVWSIADQVAAKTFAMTASRTA